jgi:ArsR family transcriptional regulator
MIKNENPAMPGLSVPLSVVKAELFKALANPARIRVLELLSEGERSVGEMQPQVGIELSHLSQQLGILRRAGLVVARKEGASAIYAIKDPLIADLLQLSKRILRNSMAETNEMLVGITRELSS